MKKITHSKGFSLIEVIISLAIFSVLAIYMMNAIKQTQRSEKQITQIIKKRRVLKNISYALRQDIQTLLSVSTNIQYLSYKYYKLHTASEFQSDYLDSRPDISDYIQNKINFPTAGFVGEEQAFYLTSSLNEKPFQLKTGYLLEDCPSGSCLVRKTALQDNRDLSSFDPDSEEKQTLIEGVKLFSLSYFDGEDWKSEFTPPPLKGVYFPLPLPLAVKIKIEFQNSNEPLSLSIPFYQALFSQKIFNQKKVDMPKNKAPEGKP